MKYEPWNYLQVKCKIINLKKLNMYLSTEEK